MSRPADLTYPWGVCDQIRGNRLGSWPGPGREALRVAYAVDPLVLHDVDAFDRMGSLLTILRMPLGLLNSALPVIILGELEDAAKRDGVEAALEQLRLELLERASEDVVALDVMERVIEVEQTRSILEGSATALLEDVGAREVEEMGALLGERMVESFTALARLTREAWEPSTGRQDPHLAEVRLLALVAVRELAREVAARP